MCVYVCMLTQKKVCYVARIKGGPSKVLGCHQVATITRTPLIGTYHKQKSIWIIVRHSHITNPGLSNVDKIQITLRTFIGHIVLETGRIIEVGLFPKLVVVPIVVGAVFVPVFRHGKIAESGIGKVAAHERMMTRICYVVRTNRFICIICSLIQREASMIHC